MEKAVGHRQPLGVRRADIALVGVYEISKLLAVPARLETAFSSVLQLLASFLDMRHGLIALLDHRGAPEMVVGSGWSDTTARRYFDRLPERAIGRIVVTKMPLVIRQMKKDPLGFFGMGYGGGRIFVHRRPHQGSRQRHWHGDHRSRARRPCLLQS
jgi:transcriptional regulator with GAF, ATPase, and Fis domain